MVENVTHWALQTKINNNSLVSKFDEVNVSDSEILHLTLLEKDNKHETTINESLNQIKISIFNPFESAHK